MKGQELTALRSLAHRGASPAEKLRAPHTNRKARTVSFSHAIA